MLFAILAHVACALCSWDVAAAQTTERTAPQAPHPTAPSAPGVVDPAGIAGTCMLGGGGRLPQSVYEHFVELAGGKGARILIVPTASSRADTQEGRDTTLGRWQKAHPGHHFEILHTRDRSVADSEAFAGRIRKATAVWFGGGSQSRIAEAYLGTRVERELHALLQRGGVIGGSSAGTAIQTKTMIAGGMAPPRLKTGFDLVPLAIADQHFTQRKRLPRLLEALRMTKGRFGVGIDEGTAIVVHQRAIRVLGKGKAHFALPKTTTQPERVVSFAAGDTTDLVVWQRAARQRGIGPWPKPEIASPVVKQGALVLAGGHHVPEAAFERFVQLAGGKDAARIVLVTSATPSLARHSNRTQRALAALGVTKVQELGAEHPRDVGARELAQIRNATGVWFDGGRAFRVLDAFDGTGMADALRALLARGGTVGGIASLQAEVLLRGDADATDRVLGFGYTRGLCLLPGTAIGDQYAQATSTEDLHDVARAHPGLTVLHIPDHSAAVVKGAVLEAVGRHGVTILTCPGPEKPPTSSTVAPGKRWDLELGKSAR